MIPWMLSVLAALGLVGSTPSVAPSKGPSKSTQPAPVSPARGRTANPRHRSAR